MINQNFHAIRASIISGQKGNEYLILSTKSACKKCSPSTFEKGVEKFDIITTFEPPERITACWAYLRGSSQMNSDSLDKST